MRIHQIAFHDTVNAIQSEHKIALHLSTHVKC